MRSIVSLMLLAPAFMFAVSMQSVTAVPSENGTANAISSPAPVAGAQPVIAPRVLVGTLDTIGGTTYDWWANGPIWRMLVNSPGHGVHATWMFCNDVTGQDFPSRRMYYNFYDYSTHAWTWVGSDFMADDGIVVFPASTRTGYGNIDADSSGAAVVSCHTKHADGHFYPWVAWDAGPGLGIFSYQDSTVLGATFQWPALAVGGGGLGTVHIFPLESTYVLEYSHCRLPTDSWSTPVTGFNPGPGFIDHNIAASKVSNKVALTWVVQLAVGSGPQDGYVDFSTDAGQTWGSPTKIDTPSAYAADSMRTSFDITSIFPYYDRHDRFHIVAGLAPCGSSDTIQWDPAEIWHYCPDDTPQWNLIHTAYTSTLPTGVAPGYNCAYACRPSIGEDSHGNLFVTWEQFDSLNYEPTTNRLRADIFAAKSTDNGVTWGDAVKLTDAGSYSMRFPSVIDYAIKGDANSDTMAVMYEIDSIAGFYVESEGPATHNPVVVQKLPVDSIPTWHLPGVAMPRSVTPPRLDAAAEPNPFGRSTRLSFAVPRRGRVSLDIFDAAGRKVRTLVDGRCEPGSFSTIWDGRSQAGVLVPGGVYLYRYALDGRHVMGKLTLTR